MAKQNDVVIEVNKVSKKFAKNIKASMKYGLIDIMRNIVGLKSKSQKLRKDEFWAVENVSFKVNRGDTIGLIGVNGSGKSTLLKMLNGIYYPDSGKITISGRVGALIEVGAGFHPLLTGRENIYINGQILGMSKKEIDAKFDEIVAFADIGDFLDSPVKHYSSGMYVRLGFAVAIHCEPDILLVDEILAVGDFKFQAKCFNKLGELKKQGVTTFIVSHNMNMINAFTDKAILIHKGKMLVFNSSTKAIDAYFAKVSDKNNMDIEQVQTGNDLIKIKKANIKKRKLQPLDCFTLEVLYTSKKEYRDLDIDIAIYASNEWDAYYRATNKAFNQKINLHKGDGSLVIDIDRIPLQNCQGTVAISVWTSNRDELLFWWRIPITFANKQFSTGKNYLTTTYKVKK